MSERLMVRLLRAMSRSGIARVKSTFSTSMSFVMTCPPMTAASSPVAERARGSRAIEIRVRSSPDHRHDRLQRPVERLAAIDDRFEKQSGRRRGRLDVSRARIEPCRQLARRAFAAPDLDQERDRACAPSSRESARPRCGRESDRRRATTSQRSTTTMRDSSSFSRLSLKALKSCRPSSSAAARAIARRRTDP